MWGKSNRTNKMVKEATEGRGRMLDEKLHAHLKMGGQKRCKGASVGLFCNGLTCWEEAGQIK